MKTTSKLAGGIMIMALTGYGAYMLYDKYLRDGMNDMKCICKDIKKDVKKDLENVM